MNLNRYDLTNQRTNKKHKKQKKKKIKKKQKKKTYSNKCMFRNQYTCSIAIKQRSEFHQLIRLCNDVESMQTKSFWINDNSNQIMLTLKLSMIEFTFVCRENNVHVIIANMSQFMSTSSIIWSLFLEKTKQNKTKQNKKQNQK